MHLGLIDGLFLSHMDNMGALLLYKVPEGPQTYTLNVLWLQDEGAQIHMSE
jgi:hypothetical protein